MQNSNNFSSINLNEKKDSFVFNMSYDDNVEDEDFDENFLNKSGNECIINSENIEDLEFSKFLKRGVPKGFKRK